MTPARRTVQETLVPIILVVSVLYFGREFLIPLALAILFSFLLAPLVIRLERLRLGRVASVIITTLAAFAIIGGIGAIVAGQIVELAGELPKYQDHLHRKIEAIKSTGNGPFAKAATTVKQLTKELSAPENAPPAATPPMILKETPGYAPGVPSLARTAPGDPIAVRVVQTTSATSSAAETVLAFITPILGPLGTAALVIIFVIFILLAREDMRDRVIHLIGRGHLRVTTQALDEAADRVSRYLLAQCLVNATYGIPIGVGLYFIGIPNSFLWGLLATVLRFIPYIGPWIASSFPLLLSLAISDGWSMPLMTLGLFLGIELISNNVVEPWLYGASTGLSPVAIIVSAAFWTWLWGTIGLLLATPLTVCIAVLGKYIPSLTFLDVLLGDKPPISPEDRFYQRLLATDEDEVCTIATSYRNRHTLGETFDTLLVPALRLADEDFHSGALPEPSRNRIYEIVRDLIPDLDDEVPKAAESVTAETTPVAVCVPASDYADEVIAMMLGKLLAQTGNALAIAPSKLLASEMIEWVAGIPTKLVSVSVLPPGSTRHAVYVSKRLRERFPEARIVVGMWDEPVTDTHRLDRFKQVKVDGVVTSLQEMVKEILATGRVATVPEAAAAK
jgi:predicted PurR-regulated permease PerM